MQATGSESSLQNTRKPLTSGARHVTIFCSDIPDLAALAGTMGHVQAAQLAAETLTLQEIVITRDGLGQILQLGPDSMCAAFESASAALNCALELQRLLERAPEDSTPERPKIRIGLHTGEVMFKEGERIELISRHLIRARRVMEAARPGQILASDVVLETARDFIELSREHQGVRFYGDYYLKGAGATALCEISDLRFRMPEPPQSTRSDGLPSGVVSRLELTGYRPMGRLGEGPFGVVYEAEQEGTLKKVAVKVLNAAVCEDPRRRERFAAELSRLNALGLDGVVAVLEHHLNHQPPFIVRDFMEALPLDSALSHAPFDRIARVFQKICEILQHVHEAGLIHGDLKPGNILVRKDDSVMLADFGLSVLITQDSFANRAQPALAGSPAYMAPELISGRGGNSSTDVYSTGALLYKILTGKEPFSGETVHEIVQGHLYEDPVPPAFLRREAPDGLQRICLKALEKKAGERYVSAAEMAADLARFAHGELVRTRPTVYDNLLYHRVEKHVQEIKAWSAKGLLAPEESHRLLSSYEGLQRRGIPAVMEARMFRIWQTLVYIGGWAVVNGALLWLITHWNQLSRVGKLALGSVPTLTTFALAAAMWRAERFRLVFVALVVAVLATPLMSGVWLHEFKIGSIVPEGARAFELFQDLSDPVTNHQLLMSALAMLLAAGGVMIFTRTTSHSFQAVIAFALYYSALLLRYGLRISIDHGRWAHIAMQYLPWLACAGALGWLLLQSEQRRHQARPWIYFAAVLFLVIGDALALHSLDEWTKLEPEIRKPLSLLLLSVVGIVQTVIGLVGRNYLQHTCRLATSTVIIVGLANILLGLGMSGWSDVWPSDWWKLDIFGRGIPFGHAVLPAVAITITLLACRFQMMAFLLIGLIGLTCSIHILGQLYFAEVSAWPKLVMISGVVCFFGALYRELGRTRGNTIDDLVGRARL